MTNGQTLYWQVLNVLQAELRRKCADGYSFDTTAYSEHCQATR